MAEARASEGQAAGSRRRFRVERGTRASRLFGIAAALVALILLGLPFMPNRPDLSLIGEMAAYLALAELWNLLAGFAGLVSAGQQLYVGLGGYFLVALTGMAGIPVLPALLLAGVACALLAVPVAFLVFRLKGAHFAIGTWVVAEIAQLVIAQMPSLGAGSGISLTPDVVRALAPDRDTRETVVYLLSLAILVLVGLAIYWLLRSRHGLALTAIRDSEIASQSLGVDTYRAKLVTYVATAFGTGITGALILLQKLRISPEAGFSVQDWTVVVIFMVVIGGIGTLEGPILGMLLYFLLRQTLADYGTWYLILLGLVAVLVMIRARDGLWGLISRRADLHLFPLRRRLTWTDEGSGRD